MELTQNAIQIENLHFSYGQKQVLEGVNASFPKNKFSVLLGSNGGGKSTLFKIIAGLLTGFEGKVSIGGCDSTKLKYKERARMIGFLPQFTQSVFSFTVEEILLTGRTAFSGFAPKKSDRELLCSILEDLEIMHLKNKAFPLLSGGEQQIVMIGRLLMQKPNILLLDEPTNHLDVYYQHYLMEKLKKYSENNYTVLSIMHNPTLAFQYADHFCYLNHGLVYTSDQPSIPDINLLEEVYNIGFIELKRDDMKFILPCGELETSCCH